MDNTNLLSYKTVLDDRVLWYDGSSVYNADKIVSLIKKGISIEWVDRIIPVIEEYNKLGSTPIKVKNECKPLNMDWNIPKPYDILDPIGYIIDRHIKLVQHISPDEQDKREARLAQELIKFKEMKLIDVLRAIIYIINTLISSNTIWGIGRGSSVSSYVLYVIGVHDVDSFAYDLDIDDFLH